MISLLGYMGSGKSTIANEVVNKLNVPLYDLDSIIECETGSSIADIFSNYGSYYFRKLERRTLKETLTKEPGVISLGGGTPCFYNNIELITNNSTSIYLKNKASTLYDRLILEKEKRPIISNIDNSELLTFIENNILSREQYYKKAKFIINNENIAHSVNQIIALYHENIH